MASNMTNAEMVGCGGGSDEAMRVPVMRCSFPARLHPEYERVREACEPWIVKVAGEEAKSSGSCKAREQLLLDCLLPRYVCRLFPDAPDVARLQAATKFIAWLTLADDVLDMAAPIDDMAIHPEVIAPESSQLAAAKIASSSATRSWAHCVLSTLAAAASPRQSFASCTPPPPTPIHCELLGGRASILLDALAEVWSEVSAQMSPRARARFVAAMEQHLAAVELQQQIVFQSSCNKTNNKKKKKLLLLRGGHLQGADVVLAADEENEMQMGVAEYMAIRRQSSGFVLGFELLLYVVGLEEDPVHRHPLLQELRDLCLDYMCMCNDVVSWRMERAAGDFFNLPSVVYGSGMAATLPDAARHVAHLMHRLDARCAHVVRQLLGPSANHTSSTNPTFGDMAADEEEEQHHDPAASNPNNVIAHLVPCHDEPRLRMYVHTMVSCMSGTLRWSFETIRYGLRHHDAAAAAAPIVCGASVVA